MFAWQSPGGGWFRFIYESMFLRPVYLLAVHWQSTLLPYCRASLGLFVFPTHRISVEFSQPYEINIGRAWVNGPARNSS